MIHKLIVDWYKNKPRPNMPCTLLHQLFIKEYSIDTSYQYFDKVSKEVTTVKTIRTGAAEINLSKLADVITERAMFNVNIYNTISIDEKPFIPKQFLPKSMRVLKSHNKPIYKQLFFNLKRQPIYIISAVTCRGMICSKLFDHPILTSHFQNFIAHLCYNHRADHMRFLLFDNASFHFLDEETKLLLRDLDFSITKTPPSGCFTDPIEEYFAIVDQKFRRIFYDQVVNGDQIRTFGKKELISMVEEALRRSDGRLIKQFRRALL